MGDQRYDKLLNSAYIKLCVIELCLQLGMQTATPVVSNAALALGATVTIAGILAGLSTAVSVSLRIVSGRIVSLISPKTALVVSAAALMAPTLVFGLFSSVPMLAFTRVVYGVGVVVKTVIVVTVCVRVVPKNSIGQATAWLGMASVLAVAIGPNLTQYVGLNMGYSASFILSGLLFAVGTILCATFPSVPRGDEKDAEKAAEGATQADNTVPAKKTEHTKGISRLWDFIYRDTLPLAFLALLEGVIFGIVNTLTLAVGLMRGLPETSLFFLVYGIVSFGTRAFVGKLYDRLGFAKICPAMCFVMGLSMLTLAFADSLAMIVVSGVLFALGQGCLWPCMTAESVRDVPLEKGSLSTNTFLFGFDLGVMLGPMLGGAILDLAGPLCLYLFGTCIGVFMTLWSLQYIRIMKKRAATRNPEQ